MCSCNLASLSQVFVLIPCLAMLFLQLPKFKGDTEISIRSRGRFFKLIQTINLLITCIVFLKFLFPESGYMIANLKYSLPLVDKFGINYSFVLNLYSAWFLLLSAILFFITAFCAKDLKITANKFISMIFLLQTSVAGVLLFNDALLFYLSWELMLIPIFILISSYGEKESRTAALRFVLYTVAGGLCMLSAIAYLSFKSSLLNNGQVSFAWEALTIAASKLSFAESRTIFWLFIIAFLVKIPLFPLHSWLPISYKESPYGLNVILAGIVGKLGIFGILQYIIPMFEQSFYAASPALFILALVTILYSSIIAFYQSDLKLILAYSSFAHVAMCVLVLAAIPSNELVDNVTVQSYSREAIALFQVLSHGIIVAGLFLMVMIIESFYKSRILNNLGGLASLNKSFAILSFFLVFSSIAVPGSSAFIAEFLTFTKVFEAYSGMIPLLLFVVIMVVLSAAYMLKAYRLVFLGSLEKDIENLNKESFRNNFTKNLQYSLLFCVVITLLLGIFPNLFFSTFSFAIGGF